MPCDSARSPSSDTAALPRRLRSVSGRFAPPAEAFVQAQLPTVVPIGRALVSHQPCTARSGSIAGIRQRWMPVIMVAPRNDQMLEEASPGRR